MLLEASHKKIWLQELTRKQPMKEPLVKESKLPYIINTKYICTTKCAISACISYKLACDNKR